MRIRRFLNTFFMMLIISLTIAGCASVPLNKNLTSDTPLMQQPTEVVIGISQTEILPMFYLSKVSTYTLGGLVPSYCQIWCLGKLT